MRTAGRDQTRERHRRLKDLPRQPVAWVTSPRPTARCACRTCKRSRSVALQDAGHVELELGPLDGALDADRAVDREAQPRQREHGLKRHGPLLERMVDRPSSSRRCGTSASPGGSSNRVSRSRPPSIGEWTRRGARHVDAFENAGEGPRGRQGSSDALDGVEGGISSIASRSTRAAAQGLLSRRAPLPAASPTAIAAPATHRPGRLTFTPFDDWKRSAPGRRRLPGPPRRATAGYGVDVPP